MKLLMSILSVILVAFIPIGLGMTLYSMIVGVWEYAVIGSCMIFSALGVVWFAIKIVNFAEVQERRKSLSNVYTFKK